MYNDTMMVFANVMIMIYLQIGIYLQSTDGNGMHNEVLQML